MSADFWFQEQGGSFNPDLIGNSLRFRGQQYLSRSFSGTSSGQGQVWTTSMWLKDAVENTDRCAFAAGNGGEFYSAFNFMAGNSLGVWTWVKNNGQRPMFECGNRFRDPTAWFHLVVRTETTNSNGALRDRFYINGVEYTNFPVWRNESSQNQGLPWMGSTVPHYVGANYNGQQPWRGFMAEVHCCDGQSLGPENFGAYNDEGVWVPIIPSGLNYGSWGFHLDFSDPNNIGADRSGNGNNWTASGFELSNTTSTLYDSMTESPTNNCRAWNNMAPDIDMNTSYTEANMRCGSQAFGMNLPSTGKWYWENTSINTYGQTGLIKQQNNTNATSASFYSEVRSYYDSGSKYNGSVSGYGAAWNNGDTIGTAVDMDAGTITMYKNGVSQGTMFTDINSSTSPGGWKPFAAMMACNFGQRPFRNSPPSGFLPLFTANMPQPSLPATITGTFNGVGGSNGPFIFTGCLPGRIQYGSVNVTYGNRLGQNDVDFLANGFKVRSGTSNSGTVSYTVTTTHSDGEYNGHQVPFGGNGVSPATAVFN